MDVTSFPLRKPSGNSRVCELENGPLIDDVRQPIRKFGDFPVRYGSYMQLCSIARGILFGSGLAKIAWPWLFPRQNLSCRIDVPIGHQFAVRRFKIHRSSRLGNTPENFQEICRKKAAGTALSWDET